MQRGPLGSFGSQWTPLEGWQGTTPRSGGGPGLLRGQREGIWQGPLSVSYLSSFPPFFLSFFFPSLINPANILQARNDGASR